MKNKSIVPISFVVVFMISTVLFGLIKFSFAEELIINGLLINNTGTYLNRYYNDNSFFKLNCGSIGVVMFGFNIASANSRAWSYIFYKNILKFEWNFTKLPGELFRIENCSYAKFIGIQMDIKKDEISRISPIAIEYGDGTIVLWSVCSCEEKKSIFSSKNYLRPVVDVIALDNLNQKRCYYVYSIDDRSGTLMPYIAYEKNANLDSLRIIINETLYDSNVHHIAINDNSSIYIPHNPLIYKIDKDNMIWKIQGIHTDELLKIPEMIDSKFLYPVERFRSTPAIMPEMSEFPKIDNLIRFNILENDDNIIILNNNDRLLNVNGDVIHSEKVILLMIINRHTGELKTSRISITGGIYNVSRIISIVHSGVLYLAIYESGTKCMIFDIPINKIENNTEIIINSFDAVIIE